MSESLVIFGKTWTGVNGFKVKDTSDNTKTYIKQDGTVTQNLTNVTSSNQNTIAAGSWATTLSVADGYFISSVTVTMGGVDITSQVFAPTAPKSVTANGTYIAEDDGLDSYDSVTVNVQPSLQNKTVTTNGTVTADSGYDGLGTVTVSVSGGGSSTLGTKTITANGTYNASSDSLDGYSSVTVNVPATQPSLQSKSATYTPTTSSQTDTIAADSGYDGLSSVGITVNPIPSSYIIPSGSQTVTQNGTFDVTSLAEMIVSVATSGTTMYTGTYTPTENTTGPSFSVGGDFTHFLVYCTSSPNGNSVKAFQAAYYDFGLRSSYAVFEIASNNSGSSIAGSFFGSTKWFTKSGTTMTCTNKSTSGATNAGYWVANKTYRWIAW